jgi:hypothetical protein
MTARSIRRAMERKSKKLEKKRLLADQCVTPFSASPCAQADLQPVVRDSIGTTLTGRTVLLPSPEIAEYERHLAAYSEEFAPVGLLETNLVQSIADTDWRLCRIPALESALFAKGRIEFAELFNEQDLAARPHLIDAHTFIEYEKQIRNLQLQEARLARRREKEMAELRRMQNDRTERLVAAGRIHEQRIQKQQQEISENGFVFSTPKIDHTIDLPALPPTPVSCLLTPDSSPMFPRFSRRSPLDPSPKIAAHVDGRF